MDQTDGVVTSPGYAPLLQQDYAPDTDCQWVIGTAQLWSTVQVHYLDFHLQVTAWFKAASFGPLAGGVPLDRNPLGLLIDLTANKVAVHGGAHWA